MRINAKTDYAIRALLVLADRAPGLVKLDALVLAQAMPPAFVEMILSELRRAGLVVSRRGAGGGYALALPAGQVTLGDVIRVVDGPLAEVSETAGVHPVVGTAAQHLPQVWAAVLVSVTRVLDETTLQQVLTGELPPHVQHMARSLEQTREEVGA